jgi:hypothetical protein
MYFLAITASFFEWVTKADNRSRTGTTCSQRNTLRVLNGRIDELIGAGKQTPKGKEFTYHIATLTLMLLQHVLGFLLTFDNEALYSSLSTYPKSLSDSVRRSLNFHRHVDMANEAFPLRPIPGFIIF